MNRSSLGIYRLHVSVNLALDKIKSQKIRNCVLHLRRFWQKQRRVLSEHERWHPHLSSAILTQALPSSLKLGHPYSNTTILIWALSSSLELGHPNMSASILTRVLPSELIHSSPFNFNFPHNCSHLEGFRHIVELSGDASSLLQVLTSSKTYALCSSSYRASFLFATNFAVCTLFKM